MSKRRAPTIPAQYDADTFKRLVDYLVQRLDHLEAAVAAYTITNPPADSRTIDWGTATTSDKLDFLVTIVRDLQKRGVLGS